MSGLHLVRGPQRLDPSRIVTGAHLTGLPLASFRRRAAAWLLDLTLSAVAFLLVAFPVAWVLDRTGVDAAHHEIKLTMFGNWYSVAWHAAYFGLLTWAGRGQTPGKRALGIRVRSLGHDPVSLWQSLERALGYGASLLEGGFGFVQYFLNAQRQTVHDRIAETVVVREESARPAHREGPPAADAATGSRAHS
ncbi:MAG: RDD family protein [Gemmatimonadetes bacterium]|nr:RDD family protein [Gemmatimonadota bacterium]